MITYEVFYRRHGVRKPTELSKPLVAELKTLELPVNSVLHYPGSGPLDTGPASNEFVFRNISRPIPVWFITEQLNMEGNPRPIPFQASTFVRRWHNANRRYRYIKELELGLRDQKVPLVYNYIALHRMYKYIRSVYSEYYRWRNLQVTVWKTIAEAVSQSDRQHFIMVKLPTTLPGLSSLRLATEVFSETPAMQQWRDGEDAKCVSALESLSPEMDHSIALESIVSSGVALEDITLRTLRDFNSPELLMILELWRWAGPKRSESFIDLVPTKSLNRVNLVFEESGMWSVFNLGKFNEWRKASPDEVSYDEADSKGFSAKQAPLFLLRYIMAIFQIRTGIADDVAVVADAVGEVSNQVDQSLINNGSAVQTVVQTTAAPVTNADGSVTSTATTTIIDTSSQIGVGGDTDGGEITPDHEEQIVKDLATLDVMNKTAIREREAEAVTYDELGIQPAPETAVMQVADRLADDGMISAAEYRRYTELSSKYKQIIAPGGSLTLEKFIEIPPEVKALKESTPIPDAETVIDKTMIKSSLQEFDSRYITKCLEPHVASMVLGIQQAGICVTAYEKERVNDIMGAYDSYTVRLNPVEGAPSTYRFKLPAIGEGGTYTANGVKYRMRKQRGDLPIRKIGKSTVALTSYYGKVFVYRSDKRVNDYGNWISNALMAKGLDPTDSAVISVYPGNVFDSSYKCPRLLSALMSSFREFSVNGMFGRNGVGNVVVRFILDRTQHEKEFSPEVVDAVNRMYTASAGSKERFFLVGKTDNHFPVVMDDHEMLHALRLDYPEKGEISLIPLRRLEDIIGLEASKAPVEFITVKVMGKSIPAGMILAYEMGLEKLMAFLKVKPRRVLAGQRTNLTDDEFSIVFGDETLIFPRDNRLASIILGGFNEYHKAIRSYNVHEFDKRAVYLNVLDANGLGVRYLREIDLLNQMFVDPITKDLLIQFKEPTTFRGLLVRSAQLLLTDDHPEELDPEYMRIKGYERVAGAVYNEMVKAIRVHNGRNGKSKHQLDINPFAVWKAIAQDPSVALVSDINPIENLKSVEAVTYNGVGGRNSRSMVKRMRAYHKNDMGTISEATKDSADVGINIYTSADPQFDNIYGTSKRWDHEKRDLTSLLSTAALVSPGSERDDPKRVNFVSIQHEHTVACGGYVVAPVRTGYEQVMAHRVGDMFAYTAKKPGEVIEVTENVVRVQYDDGEIKNVEIGRRYGHAGGMTVPQTIVTDVRVGQKLKVGDVVSYNSGFFERDFLNPQVVSWKTAAVVKTALMESTDTLEDSSTISKRVSELLKTQVTKPRTVVVNFDQSVRKLVKVGDKLESEDILCIIEDSVTATNDLFDEESIETLRMLGAQAPAAKSKGVVERIEVFYHGDKEDMSDSLRTIANAGDRELGKRNRELGLEATNGSVDDSFRVEGDPLALDSMAIRIYITSTVGAGVGDKGVFCNQLKTVFGQVMPKEIKSESGVVIDAIFGQKSIYDRIVLSPYIIGTTTTLLKVVTQKMIEAYDN